MQQIIQIDDRLELFVDRVFVAEMNDVEFRMHEPVCMPMCNSPLVQSCFATIIKDDDLFRAYYRSRIPGYQGDRYDGDPGEITCYAESCDGIKWSCPDLGISDVRSAKGGNTILANSSPFSHNFSPFIDTRPDVDPGERFKAMAGVSKKGLYAFKSADGVHWDTIADAPVVMSESSANEVQNEVFMSFWQDQKQRCADKLANHAFDSQNVSFWSEAEGLYVCYFRTRTTPHGCMRTISRTTSPDFLNWSRPVQMNPNLPGEELYTNQTHPYFRAPHIYVALPTRYIAGRIGGEEKKEDVGSTDILFMSTRAGTTHYDRLFTEAFIRPGLDPERWASRGNYVALNVVPTGPSEMSVYHAVSGHRYTLRTDGFISVRSGAVTGRLLTKPLIFSGDELIVNYSTSAAGSLRVELQNVDGKPVPGFSLKDCPMIVGDAIEQSVKWRNNPDIKALTGTPVRLYFEIRECDLYSFRFYKK